MSDTFRPMLAADCDGDTSKIRYPVLASPKVDGIRCVIRGGKVLTRSLKPVPNDFIRGRLETISKSSLDGELVNFGDPTNFQATSSAVMRKSGEPCVAFLVFDCLDMGEDADFEERLSDAHALVKELDFSLDGDGIEVRVIEHEPIESEEQLLAYEARCLAKGYEGVMLRDPNGKYKHGRSTLKEGGLVKLKRFADAEAVIVGFEERMHNTNEAYKDELGRTKRSSAQAGKVGRGDLGAFVLSMDGVKTTTVEFTCGSGLNDAQRVDFWARRDELLGKLVKFKYLSHGMKDAPRHPTFIGLRDVRDM